MATIASHDPPSRRVAKARFLADTGANITTISAADLELMGIALSNLPRHPTLPTNPQLADGAPGNMDILGMMRASITVGNRQVTTDVYVARRLAQPLLSRKDSLALEIYVPGPNSTTKPATPF